jgi:hypothetical protein
MRTFWILLAASLFAKKLHAADAELNMAPGSFDIYKSAAAMGQIEYRFSSDWSGFRPQAGLFVTADSVAC